MFTNDIEVQRLVEVAKLYYEENMTQDEIAKRVQVSRSVVSKMLTKARAIGIVNIQIKDPFESNTLLMRQLMNVYNLRGGFIVPTASSNLLRDEAIINHTLFFLEEALYKVKSLGIGWGQLIDELVKKIEAGENKSEFQGDICPLIGSTRFPNRAYHCNELVRIMAQKFGLMPHYLYAPAFTQSETELQLYKGTDNYEELQTQWSNLDAVVLSIGTFPSVPDQATASRFGRELINQKAVGEILSYFYDRDGLMIQSHEDMMMHIPLTQLQKVETVIAVGSSSTNIHAIIGALKTGYITHLIIDEKIASDLIKYK